MLEQMSQRLHASRTFETAVRRILIDVVALHGAEFGNIQMPTGGGLVIVAQHGLDTDFLTVFRKVRTEDGCACARALKERRPVIVIDTEKDEAYAPFRTAARQAGYRSVQSTPIVSNGGTLIGVISTLFANVHTPTPIEMNTVSLYSQLAAERLVALLDGEELAAKAQELHEKLYLDAGIG
jgi:GAF domain-containing protein